MSSRTIKCALLLSTLLLAAGCKSNGVEPVAGPTLSTEAVVCDKCHTTWVQQLDDKGHPVPFAYRSTGSEACPACDKAAARYFATGKMEECKMCGTTPKVVERSKL